VEGIFILCQFGENSIHLLSGESSQGLGPDVTSGTDGQAKRGHGCIVGCVKYSNDIVIPQCPVKLLDGNTEFFASSFTASDRFVVSLALRTP